MNFMARRIVIHLFFLFFTTTNFLQAKVSVIDSLEHKIHTLTGTTTKVNLLLELAEEYIEVDIKKAERHAKDAILLAYRMNYQTGIIKAYNLIGRIKQFQNKIPEAFEWYQKAYKAANDIGDEDEIAVCYFNVGDIYKVLGMYDKSIEYLKSALAISKKKNNYTKIPVYSDKIGHVYVDWGARSQNIGYFTFALDYYNYSLQLNQKQHNYRRLSVSNINLANLYMEYFKLTKNADYLKKTFDYSNKGKEVADKHGNVIEYGVNLINLCEASFLLNEYDEAIIYCEQALEVYKKANNKYWYGIVLKEFALVYNAKGDYKKALEYLNKSIHFVNDLSNSEQLSNYKLMSEVYAHMKDYERAYEAYENYSKLNNEFLNIKNTLEIARLQFEFDSEKKDREIVYLNKERKLQEEKSASERVITYFLMGLSLLVIVIAILIYNRGRILKKSKEISDHTRLMQEQFLANTSHEIRTPMNGIIGMTNQLLDSRLDNQQQQCIQTIKKSADNLLRMIDDLLDLSKIKAGKLDFHEKEFIVDVLLQQLYNLLQTRATEKNLKIEFRIDPELPCVLSGDALRLEQILLNLLGNAIKFTEEGSVLLDVKVKKEQGDECYVQFTVKDTGIGIPRKKLETIFDSFVQLENSGNRKYGGTGLGLSITRRLIELQNGYIVVDSEVDEGTEFLFVLPFKTGDFSLFISNLYHQRSSERKQKDLNGAKILVVEDNAINQQVIASTLTKWNAEYAIAGSAVECFDKLLEQEYDLVLMDIELPEISGWEATQYIRTKFGASKKNIPIIALTAYAFDVDKQKCLQHGMNEVVVKPFSPDELYLKMSSFLSGENYFFMSGEPVKKAIPVSGDNPLFNYALLTERYGDNPESLVEILELFIAEIPLYVNEIEESLKKEDISLLKKQVHKMKSPLGLVGAQQLIEILDNITEALSDENKEKSLLLLKELRLDTNKLMDILKARIEDRALVTN